MPRAPGIVAGMKRILVAYDGSEEAGRALLRAADLAAALGAALTVVNVAPPPPPPTLTEASLMAPGLAPAVPPPPEPGFAAEEEPENPSRPFLARAAELLAGRELDLELVPAAGDPAHTIVDLAEERGVDLVVVGRHERRFLDRLLSASVSDEVARRSRRDVLVVH